MTALKREISTLTAVELQTIYIGGGTPTALPPDELLSLIHHVTHHFRQTDDCEATIEANPGTVDREKLTLLRNSGINRISIGVQSFNDEELTLLGRIHSCKDAERAVLLAEEAGFENRGIDLIYGIPGQDRESWHRTLEKAVALNPHHISAYELTVEKGTTLARFMEDGQMPGKLHLPDEETIIGMYATAIDFLKSRGYLHYEISNFARPGFVCRHNITYWDRGEYYGAGLGAHSFSGGRRYHNVSTLDHYIRAVSEKGEAIAQSELITGEKALTETIFLGLRKTDGINLEHLSRSPGIHIPPAYLELIDELQKEGLMDFNRTTSQLRLTDKGRLLSNEVFTRFL